jgi:cysteine synthase B
LAGDIRTVSIQPETAMHGLEGWKHLATASIPRFYDPNVADETRTISTEETYHFVRKVAHHEGLIISPSSAANLLGAIRIAEQIEDGVVVTVFPDQGSNYPDVIKDIFQ